MSSKRRGGDVTAVSAGDLVIAPFIFSDGTCPHCLNGSTICCVAGGNFGNGTIDGGQGEAVRVPLAGGTLVPVPGSGHADAMLRSLLTLSDVMSTGHHAAVSAGVRRGGTVAVVGDGAVGLSAVLASQRLGAERIIALSRNPARQALARTFGATDIIEARGDEASALVLELTGGIGVDAAMECVGTAQSMTTALSIARPGSTVGIVGVPHESTSRSPTSSSATSAGTAAPPRPAATSPSCSPTSSPAPSTPASSWTSRPTSTTSPTPTRRWTSAAPSSPSCGSAASDGHLDRR